MMHSGSTTIGRGCSQPIHIHQWIRRLQFWEQQPLWLLQQKQYLSERNEEASQMVGDPSPSSILTQHEKEPKSLDANSAESPSKHLAAVQVWITPASEQLISTHFQLFSAVVTISSSNTRLKISFNIHPPAPVFFSFSIKSLFFP